MSGEAPIGDNLGGQAPETTGTGTPSTTPPVGDSGQQQNSGGGMNPAWNPLLEALPSSLHHAVIPHLREWDAGVQKKFEESKQVQSRFEPYQALIDNGVPPDEIEQALNLVSLINQDPRHFYDTMGDFYKEQWGLGGQGQGNEDPSGDFGIDDGSEQLDPRMQEIMQNQQMLAQAVIQQEEARQQAVLEAQVEQEIQGVQKTYPDLDMVMVLQTATARNCSLEDAAKAIQEYNQSIIQKMQPAAPTVFSPAGGGMPQAQRPDPTKMNSKQTKDLVAGILAAQHGQG